MKSIKALAGGLALAAIVGANGYMAASGRASSSELAIDGLEYLAEGEMNPLYLWPLYGVYPDEYFVDWPCEYTSVVTIRGNRLDFPRDGHYRKCYDGGSMNCDSYDCSKGAVGAW